MKDKDKIFKTAVNLAICAAMAYVFVKNAFPSAKGAFVTESVPAVWSGTSQPSPPDSAADIPELSAAPESSSDVPDDISAPGNNSGASEIENSEQRESGSAELPSGLVNINTASSAELQSLTGIGEVKALAVIEYRELNGGFSCVDELLNVKGIGEKTLENIRDKITV